MGLSCYVFCVKNRHVSVQVSMPSWAWVVTGSNTAWVQSYRVSMPSWAWVVTVPIDQWSAMEPLFQCPHGLELLHLFSDFISLSQSVSMPSWAWVVTLEQAIASLSDKRFNALMGLSCYWKPSGRESSSPCFNALMGLSCYSKNAQYFKFPMILFYAYLLFISIYYHTCQFFSTNYLSFWGANPLVLFWELAFRTTLLSFFW